MQLTPILRLPPLLQVHVQWSYSAGCYSGVLTLSWKSWAIHFAFFEMNYIFAICIHRGTDALFRRGSRAGRVWYSLFTLQWEQNYCKDLTLAISAYACKAEGQKAFTCHHFPSIAEQIKHLRSSQAPIMWPKLFLTWNGCRWRGSYSTC